MNPDPTKPQARTPSQQEPQPAGASATARAEEPPARKPAKEPPQAHVHAIPPTEHLSENVAAALCYLFGWVSGIVFLLVDRRPFVRYNAAQSVAVFGTLSILLLIVSGFFLGAIFPHMAGALFVVRRIIQLTWLVATVVLMLKAAGGQKVRVRYASQYGDRAAHSR
jgi:uncharacterized membrane protein